MKEVNHNQPPFSSISVTKNIWSNKRGATYCSGRVVTDAGLPSERTFQLPAGYGIGNDMERNRILPLLSHFFCVSVGSLLHIELAGVAVTVDTILRKRRYQLCWPTKKDLAIADGKGICAVHFFETTNWMPY